MKCSYGHIDEKDVLPAQIVHDEAAQCRAEDASHGHSGADVAHGPALLSPGKRLEDDG